MCTTEDAKTTPGNFIWFAITSRERPRGESGHLALARTQVQGDDGNLRCMSGNSPNPRLYSKYGKFQILVYVHCLLYVVWRVLINNVCPFAPRLSKQVEQ